MDDQLVWWSWHSKLSAWLSVRVSQVVISVLLTERRTVTEDVQLEVVWPSRISGKSCWMEMSPMVGWPGLAVGIWVENDGIYTTSLTCTNTPHSRGARKQAHLHRGEGSVMDSLLISGRLHCQPSQQRGRSTIEGQPHARPHNPMARSCAAATDSPRKVAPADYRGPPEARGTLSPVPRSRVFAQVPLPEHAAGPPDAGT